MCPIHGHFNLKKGVGDAVGPELKRADFTMRIWNLGCAEPLKKQHNFEHSKNVKK